MFNDRVSSLPSVWLPSRSSHLPGLSAAWDSSINEQIYLEMGYKLLIILMDIFDTNGVLHCLKAKLDFTIISKKNGVFFDICGHRYWLNHLFWVLLLIILILYYLICI